MKNHTKFLLGNRPYEALKKTFWKNCYFPFKKFIGRSPKEFKEVFGQKHPNKKIIPIFIGKNTTKRNIEKTMWQNRLISKKKDHWRDVAIKVWVSMPFLGLSGGFAEWKKGMHFGAQVWVSMPFLGLSGRFAARKKGMHFGARVWISMPFLGLSGGFAARKKGMHFGARVWISMPFFGLLGGGRGVEKGQAVRGFRTGMKKKIVLSHPSDFALPHPSDSALSHPSEA